MRRVGVYLEVGTRRVFAAALDWPGWCRSGRTEDDALTTLVAYGRRYAKAIARARQGFKPPADAGGLEVAERLKGDATTDFGAPGVAPAGDGRPLGDRDLHRLAALLEACWTTFDATAATAAGTELRKGPRGGGREVDAIVSHVMEADRAYLSRLGVSFKAAAVPSAKSDRARLREAMLDAVSARAHGEPPPPSRRRSPPWAPRYAIRRSAWHALDHAWEIEDRATS